MYTFVTVYILAERLFLCGYLKCHTGNKYTELLISNKFHCLSYLTKLDTLLTTALVS